MPGRLRLDLVPWAARDLWRRPGWTLALALAQIAVTLLLGTTTLLHLGFEQAALEASSREPGLVIHRIEAGAWVPLPAYEAERLAMAIPGVVSAKARRVAGLGGGLAADLALEVFHEREAEALLSDVERAFPWPVHVTTRREQRGAWLAGLAQHGSLLLVILIPALLALALVTLASVRERLGSRRELAMLKVLGWTGADLVALQVWRMALAALPAVGAGLAASVGVVTWPGGSWLLTLVAGVGGTAPQVSLREGATWLALGLSGTLVLAFALVATLLPVARAASIDPADWLGEQGP